jgi:hypothetical protein
MHLRCLCRLRYHPHLQILRHLLRHLVCLRFRYLHHHHHQIRQYLHLPLDMYHHHRHQLPLEIQIHYLNLHFLQYDYCQ